MFEFEVSLGPFRLRLVVGDAVVHEPQGDVFASVERLPDEWADGEGRISLRA